MSPRQYCAVVPAAMAGSLLLKMLQSAEERTPVTEALLVARAQVWALPELVMTSAGPEVANVCVTPVSPFMDVMPTSGGVAQAMVPVAVMEFANIPPPQFWVVLEPRASAIQGVPVAVETSIERLVDAVSEFTPSGVTVTVPVAEETLR